MDVKDKDGSVKHAKHPISRTANAKLLSTNFNTPLVFCYKDAESGVEVPAGETATVLEVQKEAGGQEVYLKQFCPPEFGVGALH